MARHMRAGKNTDKSQGFSLIELIVVVALIGVIAGIAYPSYQDSVRKTAREIGKSTLIEVSGRQEQFFINAKSYANDLTDLGYVANGFFVDKEGDQVPAAQGVYLIQLAAATATSFTVQAVPQNAQAGDTLCGTLSLTDTGIRTANSVTCW